MVQPTKERPAFEKTTTLTIMARLFEILMEIRLRPLLHGKGNILNSTQRTRTTVHPTELCRGGAVFSLGTNEERPMTSKTIALVTAFVLSSTMALAQPSQGKAGADTGPTSNAPTTSGN